jgi:hypothetical protein
MIRPDKYTNPDYSVINISAVILKQLKSKYLIGHDELLEKILNDKKIGSKAKENYPYALDFLYLLGKIDYQEETDKFIYIVKNENK